MQQLLSVHPVMVVLNQARHRKNHGLAHMAQAVEVHRIPVHVVLAAASKEIKNVNRFYKC